MASHSTSTMKRWDDLTSILNGFQIQSTTPTNTTELEATTTDDVTAQDNFIQRFQDYVNQNLDQESLSKIPSLNSVQLEELKSGAVVKYRCMVQDVFDPQFFLARYKIINTSTGASRVECGYFRDVPSCGPNETIAFDDPDNVPVERQCFYFVPIPGEAQWVKEAYSKGNTEHRRPSCSNDNRQKRGRDVGDEEGEENDATCTTLKANKPDKVETAPQTVAESEGLQTSNKNSINNQTRNLQSIPLNMPLPDEKGIPCIVRVYSKDVELRATETVEIVGILSTDPGLAAIYDDDTIEDDCGAELQAHEPPPSLVPRLHALVVRPLHHNNPSLPASPSSTEYQTAKTKLLEDVLSLRLELLSVLEHALLGDRLAAEYLLCHLIARIYARADVLPLGKMCLNLTNCLPTQRYTQLLSHLISQVSTQCVNLEMTIGNTNSWKLIPKKDHKLNRLESGMLQLSAGTNVILDETALQQGTLDQNGLTNVRALADVINWQKVEYDFQWHSVPMHTDLNILILSEGESLLPKDFLVPMTGNEEVLDIRGHFEKLDGILVPENLAKLRAYITACRLLDYSVPDETQKAIQDDFVESRKNNSRNMTVEDFQRLLCLVRLQTLTFGKETPTVEMWNKVRGMEEERKLRLSQLPSSRQNGDNQH